MANAVKPLLALVSSWWQILGIRFCDRFAKGVRGTARDVMVAESVDASAIGSAYGLIQAMDSAGAIAGPLLALAVIGRFGMRGVFASAAIPGALCVLVAWVGIREVHRGALSKDECRRDAATSGGCRAALGLVGRGRPSLPEQWHDPRGSLNCHLGFTTCWRWSHFFLWEIRVICFWFCAREVSAFRLPGRRCWGWCSTLRSRCVSWPAGKFSDRFSRSAIAAAGYFVFAIVYFVFALAPSQLAIWLTMAFYGLFYALTNPVLKALVVESVGGDVRGRALGIYFFLTSVTTLLSSVITGALWKIYGPAVPFYFSAGIAAVGAMALLAHRSPARPAELASAPEGAFDLQAGGIAKAIP